MDECFKMLADKKVDIVNESEISSTGIINKLGLQNTAEVSGGALHIGGNHIVFPKASPKGRRLQYEFNAELQRMKDDGVFWKIVTSQLDKYYAQF